MTKQKTLKQLIDEVMEEFGRKFRFGIYGKPSVTPATETTVYYGGAEILTEEVKQFLRHSLIKAARATAEAGRVEEDTADYSDEPSINEGCLAFEIKTARQIG